MSEDKKDQGKAKSEVYEKYFHYTDKAGIDGIATSGKIKESKDTKNDAVHGPGAYLTKLGPSKSKIEVAKNNYDGTSNFYKQQESNGKVDHIVEAKLPASSVVKANDTRDIHVHKGDVDLSKAKDVKFHVRQNDGSFKTFEKKDNPKEKPGK